MKLELPVHPSHACFGLVHIPASMTAQGLDEREDASAGTLPVQKAELLLTSMCLQCSGAVARRGSR